jgi:hypothetical protein
MKKPCILAALAAAMTLTTIQARPPQVGHAVALPTPKLTSISSYDHARSEGVFVWNPTRGNFDLPFPDAAIPEGFRPAYDPVHDILYGLGSIPFDYDHLGLYTVDRSTWSATLQATIPNNTWTGPLVCDPRNGNLYLNRAYQDPWPNGPWRQEIWQLDRETGAVSFFLSVYYGESFVLPDKKGHFWSDDLKEILDIDTKTKRWSGIQNPGVRSMAFHPLTGVLYGLAYSTHLVTVDLGTGAITWTSPVEIDSVDNLLFLP